MQLTQIITRSSLAAIALLNLSLATSAIAEPIVVTRGPNGAAHIVQSNNIPIDAKQAPRNEAKTFPQVTQKGPGGAAHIVNESQVNPLSEKKAETPRLIRRGTHGAFTLSSK